MPSRTHILDFLILLVTFLCIIHSHSSDRRPPTRNTLTLSISHLVSTRKPSHLSAQQPSKIHNKLYISLILIMHDIELNPDHIWYHTTCMHMSSTTYESLDNISWHCASCSITQFKSSLSNSPTSVSNSFSSLDISTSPTNNRLASQPTATAQRIHAHKPSKIINITFQTIKNKTAELGNFISESDPDILIGTETWLNHTITDNEFFHQATHFYEKTDKTGMGGILLAIKSDIIHEPIATPAQLEMTATKLHLNNNKHVIIAAMYRPPNSDQQYINDMCNAIEDQTQKLCTLGGRRSQSPRHQLARLHHTRTLIPCRHQQTLLRHASHNPHGTNNHNSTQIKQHT